MPACYVCSQQVPNQLMAQISGFHLMIRSHPTPLPPQSQAVISIRGFRRAAPEMDPLYLLVKYPVVLSTQLARYFDSTVENVVGAAQT